MAECRERSAELLDFGQQLLKPFLYVLSNPVDQLTICSLLRLVMP